MDRESTLSVFFGIPWVVAWVVGIAVLGVACSGADGSTAGDDSPSDTTAANASTVEPDAVEPSEPPEVSTSTVEPSADAPSESDGGAESVHILAAFFGLDDGIPGQLFGCGMSGLQDGMPIVLDRRIPLPALLDPSVFVVHRASGAESPVGCATLAPADEAEERRTILLVGEFASDGDPPVGVEIVGTLLTDDGVDAKGALVETVVPLAAGPSIVLAEHYLISELPTGGTDECPAIPITSSKPLGKGASQVLAAQTSTSRIVLGQRWSMQAARFGLRRCLRTHSTTTITWSFV